ncbi:hypothetical protein CONPUDRAFT_119346 [Coniophora puteana RWD-64-598 SS2]|uniref:MICOS complex subunit MIC60 n=1 Tax=Coniophora puteana (strain RWD-64-598) TaxID=741705 RepID=A0A5M3MXN2_CONPW|nr:uncharacterized protein CONPUDRAFT_119346 [Coniophora puteana RWD-64-598 SS2]EIW83923.1 hypothetical protein CONPUDRAFT_119346 [Coniophora puteana RWD-64-598 SS2]
MLRVAPVVRQASSTASRGALRSQRRRLATEATTPPKKNVLRRLIFYTVAGTGTFYLGSTFVSFENQQYREFFTSNVPLADALIDYGEANKWDEITIQSIIVSSVDAAKYVSDFVQKQLGNSADAVEKSGDVVKEKAAQAKDAASSSLKDQKERVKSAASSLRTSVKKNEEKITEKGSKAAAIARHQAAQFSEEVEELVRKAEAAIAGKSMPVTGVTTTPEQPAGSPPDAISPSTEHVELVIIRDGKEWDVPLPIGFEPPPGFSRPAPPKPKPTKLTEPAPAPEPLPLVAPTVSEWSSSEPVISQLASTIDNLASFLNSNPTAAGKAKDILETAKLDLSGLAERMHGIKEEERKQLEAKLDDQAREYTLKLLELEMDAQDKLDSQEQDYRHLFDSERAKFVQAHREKLDQELKTQTELINERLKEEVIAQGIELQRRWIREVKIRVEQERGGRLAKLDELSTNLKKLERIALDNSTYLDDNIRVHGMWTALRSLQNSVDATIRKPFRDQLNILRHIAVAKDDQVMSSVLESLEKSDVPDVGVEPFADLASWFSTSVAPRVSSVALVPDQNAGVLAHLASHLFSTFRFQRRGFVGGNDTLSVLARAEYHMNKKDLDSAARELNQLKGTAAELLRDWLEAARRRLEMQQALEVMQAQATLASLLVV